MSLYSAIQFTSVSFLYASASNLGDFQVGSNDAHMRKLSAKAKKFLFIDILLVLPIAIFSGSRSFRINDC